MDCHHGRKFALESQCIIYCNTAWKFVNPDIKVRNVGDVSPHHLLGDHPHLMKDPEFCKYLFATCTTNYMIDGYGRNQAQQIIVMGLLQLGLEVKYLWIPMSKGKNVDAGSVEHDNFMKYFRDVFTDERGLINCLSRETRQFCDCIASKNEARTMEKLGLCHVCEQLFPKETLRYCTGCQSEQYCSRKCYVNHWPIHKKGCDK
jgi:hypothetical protein